MNHNGHPHSSGFSRLGLEASGPAPPSSASSGAAAFPQTPGFVGALSAAVVPTLESTQIYEAVGGLIQVNDDGEFVPAQSKRRKFPPGLRRLRDRLHTLESRLQLEVNALKQEIADLNLQSGLFETRRDARHARLAKVTSHTVQTYFEMFHHGISATNDHEITVDEEKPSSTDGADPEPSAATQRAFIEAAAHPEMRFGPFVNGADALFEQWARYSSYHDSFKCSLSGFSSHGSPDEPIVIAHGVLSGYVTQGMVDDLCPDILEDTWVARRIVGSFVEYPVRKIFHFNDSGLLVRLDWSVDFVAALQIAVGSLALVQRIVSGGLIQENGYLIV